LVSIGHRKTLYSLHQRRFDLEPANGAYRLRPATIEATA
jgi:hypothetical protein